MQLSINHHGSRSTPSKNQYRQKYFYVDLESFVVSKEKRSTISTIDMHTAIVYSFNRQKVVSPLFSSFFLTASTYFLIFRSSTRHRVAMYFHYHSYSAIFYSIRFGLIIRINILCCMRDEYTSRSSIWLNGPSQGADETYNSQTKVGGLFCFSV